MFLYKYLILLFFFVLANTETLNELYQLVTNEITAAAKWTPPTNNEKLYATNSSSVESYGHWDFIIVGGGSAGSFLAGRLSEVYNWKILLLEAGSNQTEVSDIPSLTGLSFRSDRNWAYYTSPQKTSCQGMVNKRCVYTRGKVLGGCAVINGIVNARGIPADFDEWEAMGNQGWSYKDVLPFFKSFEKVDFPNADPYYYGQNGNIHVNFTYPPSGLADIFFNGNIQNGLPEIDYNGKGIHGVSKAQFHIKGNRRDNSAHEFIDPAQKRSNLKIALRAFVTKILVKQNIAYGVEFIKDGKKYHATVENEIILSAGAINSPQILLLSGIGPHWQLLSKGICPKVNLSAVGKHLKDHVMLVNLYFRTNRTIPNPSLRENLQRYQAGFTPLTRGDNVELLAFMHTKNIANLRNIELLTLAPPYAVPSDATEAFNFNDEYNQAFKQYNPLTDFKIVLTLLKPKSEGSVTLQSRNPIDYPIIDTGYFSDPKDEDIENMYQAIKYVLSLQNTSAFKKANATLISTNPPCEHLRAVGSRKYWYCAIKHTSSTIYHPTGSTRMGNSTANSVVNADLKVHKMKKLRVVDAGVMPNLPSGHTNSPTYMIAEKAAYKIKLEYGVK